MDFLLGFETDQEIMGYISYCLGKNSATDHFAREFINRRARLLSNDQPTTNHRSEPQINSAQSNHFQEVKVGQMALPCCLTSCQYVFVVTSRQFCNTQKCNTKNQCSEYGFSLTMVQFLFIKIVIA